MTPRSTCVKIALSESAATDDLAPGKILNLTVTFTDGKYDIFCPVPGHEAMGMNVNIVVTGGAAHATSSTKTTSPASTATSRGRLSYRGGRPRLPGGSPIGPVPGQFSRLRATGTGITEESRALSSRHWFQSTESPERRLGAP